MDDLGELVERYERERPALVIGDEVWVASPPRLAGRYGQILTFEGSDVLVAFGGRQVEWISTRDVIPAYGSEL